ncbi:hypothetical protein AGMMS49525_16450 [Bacteroidia bacterium]|nr:hypothetical protein AGMMS49525_16450 [Bacteroidia bacterium]
MPEKQNIEYKSSWHDDYLKWVCGFANAQGGKIYIGMNDAATVVGLPDQKALMEEISNKIKNNMGMTAEVNLLQDGDKYYIEIVVQPYSVPISLRGRYYYRSGSGIMKIVNSCNVAGLPTPEINEKEGGFIVTLFKDKYSEEQLQQLGLNGRQVKAVLYVKEKGKITNSEYQTLN